MSNRVRTRVARMVERATPQTVPREGLTMETGCAERKTPTTPITRGPTDSGLLNEASDVA